MSDARREPRPEKSALARRWRRRIGALLLALLASTVRAESREDLRELQERLETLRREVGRAEESKNFVVDQLRATESAVSDTNRRLYELAAQRKQLKTQLGALESHRHTLDRQADAHQRQLARLLNRQFVNGDTDALKVLLSGHDPNQAARDRYFLSQLAHAKAQSIQQLRDIANDKKQLLTSAREQQQQLEDIERREQESRNQLLMQKKERQETLTQLADRIGNQRREIDNLKRDEQRMTRLIEGLARLASQQKKPRAKVGADETTSPVIASPPPSQTMQDFNQWRGKLKLPVKGKIGGRFGQARREGGATWRGMFIRAAEGSEVKAVAAGKVVFADWLRGFGNLLIVDHGDDFLSVYGNNESLLAAVGRPVAAHEIVATVGNSGGNPESGLYFELRHRGQAFDPLTWTTAR